MIVPFQTLIILLISVSWLIIDFNVVLVGTKSLKDNIEKCNLTRNSISYLNEIKILEGEDRLEFLKYELQISIHRANC